MDNKSELKKMIKPLIKECIREVLMEQGLQKFISESVSTQTKHETAPIKKQITEARSKPENVNHKIIAEEIRKSGFVSKNFDPFANTTALTEAQAAGTVTGPMASIDPNDSGVDISGLMNGNKNVWKALVGGKGK